MDHMVEEASMARRRRRKRKLLAWSEKEALKG